MSHNSNQILNFGSFDPFADSKSGQFDSGGAREGAAPTGCDSCVHIRMRKRNARQSVCTVEGLPQNISFKRVLKHLKKTLCCNGCIVKDAARGKIIQLQGDHRKVLADFLIEEELVTRAHLKVHGY